MFNNLRTKAKRKELKKCRESNATAQLFIDFYETTKKEHNSAEDIAKVDLKIKPLKDAIRFNESFIDFIENEA